MPAVGITDGPPPCARDHQAVVLSCFHLAGRWAALERRSAWLVVEAQGQIFRISTVRCAEGLWCMRRHGPVIVRCTDLEDFLAQAKACSSETHSLSWASKTYGHNAFQMAFMQNRLTNSQRYLVVGIVGW